MNFPIQACATCGEQTENLYCPNCHKKLVLEQVKVFWNAQSWAQYRATVLDFQSFSSSLPYLETRVLDSPEDEQQPAARKMGLLAGLVAVALVALVALALWFTRVDTEASKEAELVDAGPDGKPRRAAPNIAEVRTRTPRPSPVGGQQPRGAGPARLDPAIEDVCGAGSAQPTSDPPVTSSEDVSGTMHPPAAPVAPSAEDVSGFHPPEPLDPVTELEAEDMSQNQPKATPE